MPESMLELTQTKSSPEVSRVVGTAKATDPSVKKMLWHTAVLMAPGNAFGLAAWKMLVTPAAEPAAVLILAGPELTSRVHPCSTLHSTVVTCAHFLT